MVINKTEINSSGFNMSLSRDMEFLNMHKSMVLMQVPNNSDEGDYISTSLGDVEGVNEFILKPSTVKVV